MPSLVCRARGAASSALQPETRLERYHPVWDPWPVLGMFRLYVWGLSIRASVSHPLEKPESVERQGKPERGVDSDEFLLI